MQALAGGGDYQSKVFLSRVRALPHIVYDDSKYKDKFDAMTKLIGVHAKTYGYEVEKRLPHGGGFA